MIIGLSAYARGGKDSVAKILKDDFGFRPVAYADKLREAVYALNPIIAQNVHVCSETIREGWEPMTTTIYLQDAIDRLGWDGYKETKAGPEIRRLLQRFGTEVGRNLLGENIWVDATFEGIGPDEDVAITDVRFPNEAQAIRDRGGEVWRISRTGVGPANSHSSETSLDDWSFDKRIGNTGTLDDLAQAVHKAMLW